VTVTVMVCLIARIATAMAMVFATARTGARTTRVATDQLAQVRLSRLQASVGLYNKALGGGWSLNAELQSKTAPKGRLVLSAELGVTPGVHLSR
jgi:uncharacterized membrane protein